MIDWSSAPTAAGNDHGLQYLEQAADHTQSSEYPIQIDQYLVSIWYKCLRALHFKVNMGYS